MVGFLEVRPAIRVPIRQWRYQKMSKCSAYASVGKGTAQRAVQNLPKNLPARSHLPERPD
jgi:hypothetical protein